jgi:hypothetical protein
MRRSDRAVEVMARRTPWIMRAMARLARPPAAAEQQQEQYPAIRSSEASTPSTGRNDATISQVEEVPAVTEESPPSPAQPHTKLHDEHHEKQVVGGLEEHLETVQLTTNQHSDLVRRQGFEPRTR